jgi:acyl-CoA thioester hydrolase
MTNQPKNAASAPPADFFVYHRRVAYHETDALGVVHHSNHIKYFEEARVAWLRDRGLMAIHAPLGPLTFVVLNLSNRYFKAARFDDELEVRVQCKIAGVRIYFRYALWSPRLASVIADGTTELVSCNDSMRPTRLPPELGEMIAREPWSETW